MSITAPAAPDATNRPPTTVEVPAGISVVSTRLRSTNLERDVQGARLDSLYVGARAQDILTRVTEAIEDPARTRAWSLTGPYGSGKSTLALLLDALLGPPGQRRTQAEQLLTAVNPALAGRVATARAHRAPGGFLRAVATARREPLLATVIRALRLGTARRWPDDPPPDAIVAALGALTQPGAGSAQVRAAVEALCQAGPVLLVIDEFGKTLEHLASQGEAADADDDLYLLQELAELGAGRRGLPLFILTLQHLSFLDYTSRSTLFQRREWAKIQGRFESVTYSPDLGDAMQLIGDCLDHTEVPAVGRQLICRQGEAAQRAWPDLGLNGLLPGSAELFAALYPLHPLTAVVAPLLAAQVGQHDRTLTGFLASDEPHTVRRFLAAHATPDPTSTSTIQLPQLYDYFFAAGHTTVLTSAHASRWIEIDTRISQAHGLPEQDQRILKTVGLLNLVDSAGALRASKSTILFALTDPANSESTTHHKTLLDRLQHLVEAGFLVYRNFSDEYRIWQGSDVDLHSRLDELRERCTPEAVAKLLARHLPGAVVAGRHSQVTGMLRYFHTAATGPNAQHVTAPEATDPADGLLLFHLGDDHDLPAIDSPLPVVVGMTDHASAVLEAGREVFALEELHPDPTLDPVARREVAERAAQAGAELAAVVADAFTPSHPWTRWHLLQPLPRDPANNQDGDSRQAARPVTMTLGPRLQGRSLAAIVSAACDLAYPHTPVIRNEMLGRHQLTSQGAKARRELMTAMLLHPAEEALAIQGYGPEHAMYDGVLAYLGLHRLATSQPTPPDIPQLLPAGFTEPDQDSSLYPAWAALRTLLTEAFELTPMDRVFELLLAPPYGVKAGVAPLIILVALIRTADVVAVFEDGTYVPRLSPDLVERLVKTPNRFAVKAMPAASGQRGLVLDQLAAGLGVPVRTSRASVRNPALLAVTQILLGIARGLPPYTLRTHRLSPAALAVRDALTTATDPDQLLFTTLPAAVDLPSIPPRARRDQPAATHFATRLMGALAELQTATQRLRNRTLQVLAREFSLPMELSALRREFAARAAGFADAPLEPTLKGLVVLALNDSLSDEDWLDPVVVRIIGVGLDNWTDEHAQLFPMRVRELALAFDRVSHLYRSAQLDPDRQTFDTRVVTLTDPAGREERTLVHVPHRLQDAAASLAKRVLGDAEQTLGVGGGRILLAALAQTLTAASAPLPAERDPDANRDDLREAVS